MTFLEQLQSHRGGLIRLKNEFYWYIGPAQGWDGATGRVCLLLGAGRSRRFRRTGSSTAPPIWPAATTDTETLATWLAAVYVRDVAFARSADEVLLLIDGCPQWIWVTPADVEIL